MLADTLVAGMPVTLSVDADRRLMNRVIGGLPGSELATFFDSPSQGGETGEACSCEFVSGPIG